MKQALENLSDTTKTRIVEFNQILGERLQDRFGEADVVLLGYRIDLIMPDDRKVEFDLRDVDADALVLEFAIKAGDAGSAEIVGVSCDERGAWRLVHKAAKLEFLQGCDELEEIFAEERTMNDETRQWRLDVAHDRFVTAVHVLGEAVASLGDLCEGGVVDPELHDEVYDMHKQARRIKRVLDKARRSPNGATVFHDVEFRSPDIDGIEGLRDVVGDAHALIVEYRFIVQGDGVSLDRIENAYRKDAEGAYDRLDSGTRNRLRRVKGLVEQLKTNAVESLAFD